MKKFTYSCLSIALATALTACGGDGSENNNNNKDKSHKETTTAIGQFVDAAVEGVEVFQDGKSLGVTNKLGQFTYNINGGELTFKVGKLTLGNSPAQFYVTPESLTRDVEKQIVIMQVLQSLDSDNNPNNGITITKEQTDNLVKLAVEHDISQVHIDPADIIEHAGVSRDKVVEATKAREHFAKTKVAVTQDITDKLNGYWETGCIHDTDAETGLTTYGRLFANLTKINQKDMQIQIVSHIYEDLSCTNLQSVYKENVGTKDFSSPEDTGRFTLLSANNFRLEFDDNKLLLMHRTSEKNFNTAYDKQAPNRGPVTTEQLAGYWKSDCIRKDGYYEMDYLEVTAKDSLHINNKTLSYIYHNDSCTGDYNTELKPIEIINISNLDIESKDNFEMNDGHYQRISQAIYNKETKSESSNTDAGIYGTWKTVECASPDDPLYLQSGDYYVVIKPHNKDQIKLTQYSSMSCSRIPTSVKLIKPETIISKDKIKLKGDQLTAPFENYYNGSIVDRVFARVDGLPE